MGGIYRGIFGKSKAKLLADDKIKITFDDVAGIDEERQELEEIVDSLENGDFPLEESLKLYEEGVKLVNICTTKINNVEKSVKILSNSNGELVEEDFLPNDK